ncbi:MAG: Uncharacterized protein XD91_1695 [Clostridiales bacterium 38_11]|nr:MAG: Uncharacterized protein XD91_1695 [Clostridiales bacterium 38_11]HBH13358.1 hypothetical protein [Clostridiales bacterium]
MAIVATELDGRVTLVLNKGTDGDGNTLTGNKSYSKVKPTASNDDVYGVVNGIASLQAFPVVTVRKTEEFDLVDMP